MMRMIQNTSAGQAKKYFAAELSTSDYYVNDQELQGRFQGRLADRLGLTGAATKDAFYSLCENVNPADGKSLTPRTNEQRTVGYDVNFHCPKSVSILHVLAKDDHILKAFEASVSETMRDIEADSKTSVRKNKQQAMRPTGELVWAEFTHQTARPVDGHLPDPHLHAHAFVFNATFDSVEEKIKAGQFREIKRDMPFYQARFHKRLADRLAVLGYQVRRTDKAFEIEGVPQAVIDYFSKRTDEIGRVAAEKGITDIEGKAALGAKTRASKQKGLTMSELKVKWKEKMREITEAKKSDGSAKVRFAAGREKIAQTECIDYAVQHCFERASVMDDRRVLGEAYRYALGHGEVTVDQITDQFRQDERLLHFPQGSRTVSTTKEVLQEEKQMVALARAGEGKLTPLYTTPPELELKDQQAAAARRILTTTNRVAIVQGRAGVGKTTMMTKLVGAIEKTGKKVFAVAPTAEASRGVLRSEGFKNAETVAKFLTNPEMQEKLEGQVLLVDEAGLLGTKDMTALLDLVTRKNARLILSGDTRQHSAVVRGDALRILNTVAGIKGAEVTKIRRQEHAGYREAVDHLSRGNVKEAFDKLDGIGSIKTVDPLQPHTELVDDYIAAIKGRKSALVVSPTHKQGDAVTAAIRERLRALGLIGKREIGAVKLSNLNFTEAEKSDWRNYKEGQLIQFTQNVKGIKRGETWTVKSAKAGNVEIENAKGVAATLPRHRSGNFDVFHQSEIGLSKGDKVRITRNGFDQNKKRRRLNNGMTLEVHKIEADGKIVLRNKSSKATYTVDRNFGHIAHAHCITSHAAQGKTVDAVFISQPAATFPATDMKQFYVSVSRGKQAVKIYTDDKDALMAHASEMGDRKSALELTGYKPHVDYVIERQRTSPDKPAVRQGVRKAPAMNKQSNDRDYEPAF